MKDTSLRSDGAIIRKMFQRTMVTMLFAELCNALTAIIDCSLTGQYLGASALASVGLGSPYFSLVSIVSGILMVGCTNLCTKAIGRGDKNETSSAFSLTVCLGVVLSVIIALLGLFFPSFFASLFGASGSEKAVFDGTVDYLRGVFIGAPGFIMFVILIPVLQLDGDSALPRIAGFVQAGTDIVLDLLNVKVFEKGTFGMGLASSLSHYATLSVILIHFLKKNNTFVFSFKRIKARHAPVLLRDGVPRAVCMLCRGILPVVLNIMILKIIGDSGVSAYSAMTSTSFILGALGWGIGGAVLIICGMMAGEESIRGMKNSADTALKDIVLFSVPLAAIAAVLSPFLAKLFIPDAGTVQDMAKTAILCYSLCIPFLAFNVSASNYFLALGKNLASNLVNIGIEAAFTIIMALILSPGLGILGIWIAFPAGQLLLTLVIVLRMIFGKDRAREGAEKYMMFPKGYGVAKEDRIIRSAGSMEEVIAISREAEEFCSSHGISRKVSYRISLCIEEMAGNTIEYGFADGKKHHLDIRLSVKNGRVTLRMRDDCPLFDFKKAAEEWAPDPEHPEKNIGIRMIMGIAENISYTSSMNTNNLLVSFSV